MSLKIIKGEDRTVTVLLKNSDGTAYDLTSFTEIKACFNNDAGGTIEKLQTTSGVSVVGSADCGKIAILLTDTDTDALSEGSQGFTVEVDKGTEKRKINLASSIIVEAPICS
jgi:hypothetical protein